MLPDYLDVKVHGAPPVQVLYQEVGLKESRFDRVGGGLETMPNALLTPSRRGEHPISERQSIAIRCARWEPQTFGYLPPNWWARAHASGRLRTARENKQPRH